MKRPDESANPAKASSPGEEHQHFAELEEIYRSAPVGLCFVDRDLLFVRVNDRLAAINGISASDHIGRRVRDVIPELASEVEGYYRRVLETG